MVEQYKEAWLCFQRGDLAGAWQMSKALNSAAPNFGPGWDLSSRIALAAGDQVAALRLVDRAFVLEPDSFSIVSQKASCHLALHHLEQARELIGILAGRAHLTAPESDALGNLYSFSKDHASAQRWFANAVALDPGNAHYHLNLALALQANGHLEQAEQAFDQVARLNPNDHEAVLHRSRLRKQSKDCNHVRELEKILADNDKGWRAAVSLHYALAKEHEDLDEYGRAFEHLKSGANLRRANMRYSVEADIAAMESVATHFSPRFFATRTQFCASSQPIFIVGMPRTGTTLVERILSCHDGVYAAGELNNFAEILSRQVGALAGGAPLDRGQFIAQATRVDFAALGQQYVESTRPDTIGAAHFVDKLPLNFLYCGLILKALPHARVIHLTRHPMDTCFAVYKTLFKQAYPFSYDLDELSKYYLAYRDLMRHWHNVLPGRILDVSYEDLVRNLESQSRRIASYCNLEWQPECLNFHESHLPSMTASLAQVRQPVYTSSIGRWRDYRPQLSRLEQVLSAAGLAL